MIYGQQFDFNIRVDECNARGELALAPLLGYMQEGAWHNAARLGVAVPRLQAGGLGWVMHRFRLELTAPLPHHGERVSVETWPSGRDRFFAYRDFVLLDAAGRCCARASSTWLVFDLQSRRMTPLPEWMAQIGIETHREAMPRSSGKFAFPEQYEHRLSLQSNWQDIDLNRHVNNIRYFQWCVDALPADFQAANRLHTIELILKQECGPGEALLSAAAADGGNAFLHQISAGDRVLAQGRSLWQPAEAPR